MPDEITDLQRLLKAVWGITLRSTEKSFQINDWFMTATAATIVLVIANLEGIATVVHSNGIKGGIILLLTSLVMGAIIKVGGNLISLKLDLTEAFEKEFSNNSESQRALISTSFDYSPKEFVAEVTKPLLFPFDRLARRDAEAVDFLDSEKSALKILSALIYVGIVETACGVAGIATFIFSMK